MAEACYVAAAAAINLGRFDEAEALVMQGIGALGDGTEAREYALLSLSAGAVHHQAGRFGLAFGWLDAAEKWAAEHDDRPLLSAAKLHASIALALDGRFEMASARLTELLELVRVERMPGESEALFWLSAVAFRSGDHKAAERWAREKIERAVAAGDERGHFDGRVLLAAALGDAAGLLELACYADERYEAAYQAEARIALAHVLAEIHIERAHQALEEAAPLVEIAGLRWLEQCFEAAARRSLYGIVSVDGTRLTIDFSARISKLKPIVDVVRVFACRTAVKQLGGRDAAATALGVNPSTVWRHCRGKD